MRREVVSLLKKSEIFYDAQHSEAKIVTNVSSQNRYRVWTQL